MYLSYGSRDEPVKLFVEAILSINSRTAQLFKCCAAQSGFLNHEQADWDGLHVQSFIGLLITTRNAKVFIQFTLFRRFDLGVEH